MFYNISLACNMSSHCCWARPLSSSLCLITCHHSSDLQYQLFLEKKKRDGKLGGSFRIKMGTLAVLLKRARSQLL
jgi:hypothetical protein